MPPKRPTLVRVVLFALLIAMLFAGAALAAASTEFVLYTFPPANSAQGSAGYDPYGNLTADSAGNLYGTTNLGTNNGGVVYELVRPVAPSTKWVYTVICTFASNGAGPNSPVGGVIFDKSGNLYGSAGGGGTFGEGAVFELSPPATVGDNWTLSVLHSFGASGDGVSPKGGVSFDSSGNIYGLTTAGGAPANSICVLTCGVVYRMTPPATPGGAWTETVIHNFNGTEGSNNGLNSGVTGYPGGGAAPIFDVKGNLYGAAPVGGQFGDGVIYKLIPPATEGGAWTYRVLYNFGVTTTDSAMVWGSLTLHSSGALYGTASAGGENGLGTVFELVPPSGPGDSWTENILYSFANQYEGYPTANLIFDKAGNLYSTTTGCTSQGCYPTMGGSVFELSPPASIGSSWTETTLHAFPGTTRDGFNPSGGLIFGKGGDLFGVTVAGGANQQGTIYTVVP